MRPLRQPGPRGDEPTNVATSRNSAIVSERPGHWWQWILSSTLPAGTGLCWVDNSEVAVGSALRLTTTRSSSYPPAGLIFTGATAGLPWGKATPKARDFNPLRKSSTGLS